MPASADTLLPPRYGDVRLIARGGMGEIYLATDRELGREVAVKVLAERYAEDEPLRARFKREALAAARLSGRSHIVTIFDVDENGNRPFIVMEYLAGGSLADRIDGGKTCPHSQVLEWLEQAAVALDAAHEAGIVHRDVKPANLLLNDRDVVHVADFGIASAVGLDSFTQTGTVLGTAGYLSPEQAKGERATAASDRYALAVVAWEMLAGRRPFASATPTAEAMAHVNAPIPSLHDANHAVPAAFDPIFEKALAKEPGDRYATAAEFVGDLRRAVHDDAGDTGWIEPVAPAAATRVAAVPAEASPRRWWIPVLLAVLVAGGVLAAVLATRGGSKPTAATGPRTVVRTVTSPGQTVRETVVTTAPAAPTTSATSSLGTSGSTSASPSSSSGQALNLAGYSKMGARDYAGALPLLEQAVQKLSGSGSTDEAYADYNLAYTRMALGQCTDVVSLLDRSQAIQGSRHEIDRLRKDAEKRC